MIKKLLLISMLACTLQAETITGTCKRVLDGDTLILCSPEEFKREIIQQRYIQNVEKALYDLFSQNIPVRFVDAEEAKRWENGEAVEEDSFLKGTGEYTFDTFVVGSSNRFAYNAAKKVSETRSSASCVEAHFDSASRLISS